MFSVYAFSVLSLHQDTKISFCCEYEPMLFAISRRLYGTPWGFIDSGLFTYFWSNHQLPAAQFVAKAIHGAATPSHQLWLSNDGTGVGPIAMTEIAFVLFGAKARALTLLFLLVNGMSVICFLARFRDARGAAAALLLFILTLLLFTPLAEPNLAFQAPLGGIRYYSVAGLLPALHWCLDIGDSGLRRRIAFRWTLLGTQSAILAFAILVRGSPSYLLAPVAACAWLAVRSGTKLSCLRKPVLLPATVLFVGLILVPPLAYTSYISTGRLYTVKWHRVLISLGVNPAWPFPGLREHYDCPSFPGGIAPGLLDANGQCIFQDYVMKHALSSKLLYAQAIYGDLNASAIDEKVERRAFFDILRSYPRQVVMTFIYYKPLMAWHQFISVLRPGNATTRPAAAALLAQLLLLIGVVWAVPVVVTTAALRRGLAFGGLFLAASLVPQFAAWSAPDTMIDVLVFIFCLATVIIGWVTASVILVIKRILFPLIFDTGRA